MIDLDAFMILTKYYTMCIIGKQITICDIKNCKPCINLIHCGVIAVSYSIKPSVLLSNVLYWKRRNTKQSLAQLLPCKHKCIHNQKIKSWICHKQKNNFSVNFHEVKLQSSVWLKHIWHVINQLEILIILRRTFRYIIFC